MPVRGPVRGATGGGGGGGGGGRGGGGSHYHGESSNEHSLSLEERKERFKGQKVNHITRCGRKC